MIKLFLDDLKAKGWTQKMIAEKVGIGQNMVSKFYQGKTCTLETAVKIANAFNLSLDAVISRTPPEERQKNGNGYQKGQKEDKPPSQRPRNA